MNTASQAYKSALLQQQREELIVDHLEFVRHVLGRIVHNLPPDIDLENLESAGILGLVEASQQFDPTRGVSFQGFAYRRIRGAIIDELRRNCPLPQKVLQQSRRIRQALEVLEPPVTTEDIAQHTKLTTEQVESCLEAMRLTRPGIWDESIMGQQSHARTEDEDPQAIVELTESKEVLADCIEQLPEQERVVLTLYYLEDLRLKEIGKVLGLSESRVSRVLAKAEFRLRELVRSRSR